MTDITELALIAKIKSQLENFDTVVLKEGEAVALVEALEKSQQPIVPVSVPDEYVAPVPTPTNLGYEAGWNACRAAMLAAANCSIPMISDKWIPVSERLPESNGMYFGWDGKRVLEVYCFFGGFSANQFIHGEITHWMPLPAAPQEVRGE